MKLNDLVGVVAAVSLGGCTSSADVLARGAMWAESHGSKEELQRSIALGERVGHELDTLISQVGPMVVLYIIAIFTIAWMLSRLMEYAMTVASRRGWNIPRRWGHWVLLGQFICVAWAWMMVFRPLFHRVPVLGSMLFASLALFSAIVLQESLQSIAAGFFISVRGHLHIGDQIEVGSTKGAIIQFRLTHTRLRMTDGTTQWIPNRMLTQDTIKIGEVQNASPVHVALPTPGGHSDLSGLNRNLRHLAWLSAYRRAESSVIVTTKAEMSQIDIEIQTWATHETDEVARRIREVIGQQAMADNRKSGA